VYPNSTERCGRIHASTGFSHWRFSAGTWVRRVTGCALERHSSTKPRPPLSVKIGVASAAAGRLPTRRSVAKYSTAGSASPSMPLVSTSDDVSDVPSGTSVAAQKSTMNGYVIACPGWIGNRGGKFAPYANEPAYVRCAAQSAYTPTAPVTRPADVNR
jgi:hypothetical protein